MTIDWSLVFKSRKLWVAGFAVVQTVVMIYLNIDPKVWTSIDVFALLLIQAFTVDDTNKLFKKAEALRLELLGKTKVVIKENNTP